MSPLGPNPLAVLPVDPDAGRLDALRRRPPGDAQRAVAGELQVIFLTELLRAMRKTVPDGGLFPRSPARDVYEGMFDRTMAAALGRGDPLGLVARYGGPEGEPSRIPGGLPIQQWKASRGVKP